MNCILRFWSRAGGCWLTDSDGAHRGVRCSGLNSGQCIYPIYAGHLPVLRTCSDHSNQIFDTSYICYGGSMKYSRQEYPHCRYILELDASMICQSKFVHRTDCEQRSTRRCQECIDTNLCTRSCRVPGPGCRACSNPDYFQCGDLCLHPSLECDGVKQCRRGEDEDPNRCGPVYKARDVHWRHWLSAVLA